MIRLLAGAIELPLATASYDAYVLANKLYLWHEASGALVYDLSQFGVSP
jgi:hypothetical protein